MDDLITAVATVQGAQIQANYTLWAAMIGALALIVSICVAARNTVREIKLDKIAESKRDQYIVLTNFYTKFLVSALTLRKKNSQLPPGERDGYWESHENKYFDLYGAINTVHLITTSEIRIELFYLTKELNSFEGDLFDFYSGMEDQRPKTNKLEELAFKFLRYLRKDLGIKEDENLEFELSKLRDIEYLNES